MTVDLDVKMRELSPAQRRRVLARAAELLAEEMTRRDLRRARRLTYVRIARKLRITKNGVARLEEHSNLLLFTLQRTVKAMGGNLSLIAEFPDRPPVVLSSFSKYEPPPPATDC